MRTRKDYKHRRDEIQGYVEAGMSNPQIAETIGTSRHTVSWLLVHLGIQRTAAQRSSAMRQRRQRTDHVAARQRIEEEGRRRAARAQRRVRENRQATIKRLIRKNIGALSDAALDAIEVIVQREIAA